VRTPHVRIHRHADIDYHLSDTAVDAPTDIGPLASLALAAPRRGQQQRLRVTDNRETEQEGRVCGSGS